MWIASMFPHWSDTRAATYHYNANYMVWITLQNDVQAMDSSTPGWKIKNVKVEQTA